MQDRDSGPQDFSVQSGSQTVKRLGQIACENEEAIWRTAVIRLWHQLDHRSNLSLKIFYLVGLYASLDLLSPWFPYLQSGSNNSHYYLALQNCTENKRILLNISNGCSINYRYYDCDSRRHTNYYGTSVRKCQHHLRNASWKNDV